jgi:hypothetical protein
MRQVNKRSPTGLGSKKSQSNKQKKGGAASIELLAALAKSAMIQIVDPDLSELAEADQAKLDILEAEWKRDGTAAFDHLRDNDFLAYFRIIAALTPKAIGAALEEGLLETGMTYHEFLAACLKTVQQRG